MAGTLRPNQVAAKHASEQPTMRIKRDEIIDTDTSGLRSSAEDMGAVIHAAKDIVQKDEFSMIKGLCKK